MPQGSRDVEMDNLRSPEIRIVDSDSSKTESNSIFHRWAALVSIIHSHHELFARVATLQRQLPLQSADRFPLLTMRITLIGVLIWVSFILYAISLGFLLLTSNFGETAWYVKTFPRAGKIVCPHLPRLDLYS